MLLEVQWKRSYSSKLLHNSSQHPQADATYGQSPALLKAFLCPFADVPQLILGIGQLLFCSILFIMYWLVRYQHHLSFKSLLHISNHLLRILNKCLYFQQLNISPLTIYSTLPNYTVPIIQLFLTSFPQKATVAEEKFVKILNRILKDKDHKSQKSYKSWTYIQKAAFTYSNPLNRIQSTYSVPAIIILLLTGHSVRMRLVISDLCAPASSVFCTRSLNFGLRMVPVSCSRCWCRLYCSLSSGQVARSQLRAYERIAENKTTDTKATGQRAVGLSCRIPLGVWRVLVELWMQSRSWTRS